MQTSWTCIAALFVTVFIVSLPVHAHNSERSRLAGWWGYDKDCPASDDGFALAADGQATDGRGIYLGRWSSQGDKVTIIWNATNSERPYIEPSRWRFVEIFSLVRKPQQRTALVNIENSQRALFCRKNQ